MPERLGPSYDQLHVVSDLHIGGERTFQIFRRGPELCALIQHLRSNVGSGTLGLLVNGDMVDFLAEPSARCFDPYGAANKLQRIFSDPSFAPVWNALRAFAATPGCRLVINLGNHDLELALPWVREELLAFLTGDDDAARGRVTILTDGTGFRCTVGDKRVLCVHGNEVDTWNVADHEMIRCIGRDIVQGRTVPDWTPNAGTRLVIDVMNDIKRKYAFVDLLKPEAEAVVPVLVALDDSQLPRLQRIMAVASRLSWDKLRRATGFLSQGEQIAPTSLEIEEGTPWNRRERPDRVAAGAMPFTAHTEASVLLANAEDNFRQGIDPVFLVESGMTEQLGVASATWTWVRGKSREEVLYEALRDLAKDRSFELHEGDDTFRRVDKYVGSDFDFVVTGHTHMEKEIPRSNGSGGMYFNTGSWIPRIRFTPEMLASFTTFRPVLEALRSGRTVTDLEAHSGLVLSRPMVLSIRKQGPTVAAAMQKVSLVDDTIQFGPAV